MGKAIEGGGADRSAPSAASAAPAAAERDPNALYALGSSGSESARLQRQADELAPESNALLDRVGLRPGDRALDLGCGPRGVIELLVERVSPGGQVVGADADPVHLAMASDLVASLALDGVEIVSADARDTGLASDSFDLVHARTLLVTLPDPAEVVAEMVRLVRPGGCVASLEPDTEWGSATPRMRPSTGCPRSSPRPSPAMALTRRSAAGWASCTGTQASRTSGWKREPRSTRPVTRVERSGPT